MYPPSLTINTGGGGGSVATDSIYTAKGMLAVGTGTSTAAGLAVGANGTSLVADSSTATGLKWESAADRFKAFLLAGSTSLGTNTASGTIALGTITDTTERPLCITQTFNNAGLTGNVLKLAATVTAGSGYLLSCYGGAAGNTLVSYINSSGVAYFASNLNVSGLVICSSSVALPNSSNGILFTNGGNYASIGIAPSVLGDYTAGIYNSTNACKLHVFRTRTDASNYERLALQSGSGYFELAAETAGTGTDNIQIRIKPAGNEVAALCDSASNQVVAVSYSGSASQLGLFGATPVIQQATTGTTLGFTAGAGAAVLDDSTFTGGSGSTAYTVGDIVLALKNYGLLFS